VINDPVCGAPIKWLYSRPRWSFNLSVFVVLFEVLL
jgi:hypothetical protein